MKEAKFKHKNSVNIGDVEQALFGQDMSLLLDGDFYIMLEHYLSSDCFITEFSFVLSAVNQKYGYG